MGTKRILNHRHQPGDALDASGMPDQRTDALDVLVFGDAQSKRQIGDPTKPRALGLHVIAAVVVD
ncbi:MAG: hypothetical protein ACKOBM_17160, partial [Gammaproteobacteria bacterium]